MSTVTSKRFQMARRAEEPASTIADGIQLRDADTGEVYTGHRLKRSAPGRIFITERRQLSAESKVSSKTTTCKSDSCFAVLNVHRQRSGWSKSASSVNHSARCGVPGPFCHRSSEQDVGDTLRVSKRPSLESLKTLTPCKSVPNATDRIKSRSFSLEDRSQQSLENLQICPWCHQYPGSLMKIDSVSQDIDDSDAPSRCSSGISVEYLTPTSCTCLRCPGLPSRLKPTVHPKGFIKYFCTDIRASEKYYQPRDYGEKVKYRLPSPSLSEALYKMSVSRLSGCSPSTDYAGFSPISAGSGAVSPCSGAGEETLALPEADVVGLKPYTSSDLMPLKHAAGLVLKTVAVALLEVM